MSLLPHLSLAYFHHSRYTVAAQNLIDEARGVLGDRGWRMKDNGPASYDDISVFVVRPRFFPGNTPILLAIELLVKTIKSYCVFFVWSISLVNECKPPPSPIP